MSHARSLLSPTEALYQAFVSSRPTIRSHSLLRARRHEVPNTFRRTYAYINRTHVGGITDRAPKINADAFPEVIKNHDIKAPEVYIVDPATNALGHPRNRLRTIRLLNDRHALQREGCRAYEVQPKDLSKNGQEIDELFLVQVGMGKDEIPICKIMERKLLILQRLERKKLEKEKARQTKANVPKEIEVNWAVTQHDLEGKLRQMENFLSKGKKVNILLANKKKSRRASPDEAEQVLNWIRKRIVDIGAKESKPMDGKLLGQATLTIEHKT